MDIEAAEKKEMQKKTRLVAGLFLLAVVLAMIFAYWMGAFGFGPSKHFFVHYDFAGGIERGSTVRLAGIKVGRVSEIKFVSPEDSGTAEGRGQLKLKIEVNNDAFKQLTEDSKFYVNLAGLIGERYVEIVPGTGNRANRGTVFRGVDPPRVDQLLSQGYGIFGDLRSFFQENKNDLKEMLNTLNELSKNLGKIMGGITPDQKKDLTRLLKNFSETSQDLRTLVGNLNDGVAYISSKGGTQTWDKTQNLIERASRLSIHDIRKLMLEDGMKVNFSSKKIDIDELKKIENGVSSD
jgi:phospholipid/cholesterol/gamma-HCH transport system substrate-binding protein